MPKYSGGNWRVDGTSIVSDVLQLRVDEEVCPYLIAEVTPHTTEETEANAHLIASAPDLYEALMAIIIRVEKGLALGDKLELEPARLALAKADETIVKKEG